MTSWAKIKRLPRQAQLQARRMLRDITGVAAVEFAMVVPIMVVMMLGCVETSDALTVSSRMINISGAVADMVGRCNDVSASDITDIMKISKSLLGKYNAQPPQNPLTMQVIALQANAQGVVTVAWSADNNGGQPFAAGAPYPNLPFGLINTNGFLVVANASYQYKSPIGHYIHGTIKLAHTAYGPARNGVVNGPAGNKSCTF